MYFNYVGTPIDGAIQQQISFRAGQSQLMMLALSQAHFCRYTIC